MRKSKIKNSEFHEIILTHKLNKNNWGKYACLVFIPLRYVAKSVQTFKSTFECWIFWQSARIGHVRFIANFETVELDSRYISSWGHSADKIIYFMRQIMKNMYLPWTCAFVLKIVVGILIRWDAGDDEWFIIS